MELSRGSLVTLGNVTESLTVLPSGGEIVMPGWSSLGGSLVTSGNVTESLTVLPSGSEIVMPGWSSLGDPWSLQVM